MDAKSCTDPDNCRLCKALHLPGASTEGLFHAGLLLGDGRAAPTLAEQIAFVRQDIKVCEKMGNDVAAYFYRHVLASLERLQEIDAVREAEDWSQR